LWLVDETLHLRLHRGKFRGIELRGGRGSGEQKNGDQAEINGGHIGLPKRMDEVVATYTQRREDAKKKGVEQSSLSSRFDHRAAVFEVKGMRDRITRVGNSKECCF
jgi:hypothetical protein